MFLDENELEKQIKQELDNKMFIVDIPFTQVEFNDRFSLVNGEFSVDEIHFEQVTNDDLDLVIEMPVTNAEFNKRFII
jgi:hypothetical protein